MSGTERIGVDGARPAVTRSTAAVLLVPLGALLLRAAAVLVLAGPLVVAVVLLLG